MYCQLFFGCFLSKCVPVQSFRKNFLSYLIISACLWYLGFSDMKLYNIFLSKQLMVLSINQEASSCSRCYPASGVNLEFLLPWFWDYISGKRVLTLFKCHCKTYLKRSQVEFSWINAKNYQEVYILYKLTILC